MYNECVEFIEGDIRNYDLVKRAVAGVDVVFHIASYGMSGRYSAHLRVVDRN